jgi:hypothetical protein
MGKEGCGSPASLPRKHIRSTIHSLLFPTYRSVPEQLRPLIPFGCRPAKITPTIYGAMRVSGGTGRRSRARLSPSPRARAIPMSGLGH